MKIELFKGKVFNRVERIIFDPKDKELLYLEDYPKELILFVTDDNCRYIMTKIDDCCCRANIKDITGDLCDLIDSPILQAEENFSSEISDPFRTSWTFYKLATIKGYVTIEWESDSNGYYNDKADIFTVDNDIDLCQYRCPVKGFWYKYLMQV